MLTKLLSRWFLVIGLTLSASYLHALPALQLGPGDETGWAYDDTDQTWKLDGDGTLNAYANATQALGGNGAYAWDTATIQWAYLVVAATPNTTLSNVFDITVSNNGIDLGIFDSGNGNPPLEDPNSMAGHSIFDTYFEIYKFEFMVDSLGTISNTQPDGIGGTGTGQGYTELFNISLNSADPDLLGIHFDLFTVNGDGLYTPEQDDDRKLVYAFAPFSHDAEFTVPEPGPLFLLGLGLLGLLASRRLAFLK